MHLMIWLLSFLCILAFIRSDGIKTTKRRPAVIYDGWIWRRLNNLIKDGTTQVWVCVKKGCNARAYSPIGSEALEVQRGHEGHRRSGTSNELRQALSEAKDKAAVDTGANTRTLLAEASASLGDEAVTKWSAVNSARAIQRLREIPGRKDVDAPELIDIIIEGVFAEDVNGNPFLRFDSRITQPDEPIFFLFMSNQGVERLQQFREWSSVTPSNIFQLYTVNVLVDLSSIPCAFVMMTDKTQASYTRVLHEIHSIVQTRPNSVMLDFEIAARNAYVATFPGIAIRQCLFHLGQSIHRYVQKNGLVPVYDGNEEYRKLVRSLAALSLLPVEHTTYGFDLLLEDMGNLDLSEYVGDIDEPLPSQGGLTPPRSQIPAVTSQEQATPPRSQGPPPRSQAGGTPSRQRTQAARRIDPTSVFTYFRRYYIDGVNGRPATFPPETWNHFETQLDGHLGRTNNAQEGFHSALNKRFHGSHPSLSKVITLLKSEDSISTEKLRPHLLDPTERVTMHPRNKKYVANDRAINTLVQSYNAVEAPTDEQLRGFLLAVQYRLGKNNFNQWDN